MLAVSVPSGIAWFLAFAGRFVLGVFCFALLQIHAGLAGAQEGGEEKRVELAVLPWLKVCPDESESGAEGAMCMLIQEVRSAEDGRLFVSASLRLPKGEDPFLLATVPTRVLLRPGMRLQVDDQNQIAGQFLVCDSTACLARFPGDSTLVSNFKKGKEVALIAMMGGEDKATAFKMSLSGFTKAHDGPSIGIKAFGQKRKEFVQSIRQKSGLPVND